MLTRQLKVMLKMSDFLSESRLSEQAFKDLSSSEQKQYLKKYPKSKHRRLFKNQKSEKVEDIEPKKKKKQKNKDKQNPEKSEKKKKKKVKPEQIKAEVNTENAQKKKEQEIVEKNLPVVADSISKGTDNLAKNADEVAQSVDDRVSPHLKKALSNMFKRINAGLKPSKPERENVRKTSLPIMKYAVGAAALSMMGPFAAPVMIIMAAKFAESFDFTQLVSSSSASPEEEDPIKFLTHDVSRYMSKLDKDMLARRFAEFSALHEMSKDSEEEDSEDFSEEDEMVSESSVMSRISFQVLPSQRRLAPNLRTQWLVKHGDSIIGKIQSDPKILGNGHQNRCWVVTLEDGFDESSYNSGVSDTQPFTVLNKGRLLLRNPQRFTMQEAKVWAKSAINREYL